MLKKVNKSLAKQDTLKALKLLNTGIEKSPNDAELFLQRSLLKIDRSEYQPALVDLNSYKSLRPDDAIAEYHRGRILMAQGKYTDAIVAFSNFLKTNTADKAALSASGICHMRLQQYDEALKAFESVLETEPQTTIALYNAGLCQFYQEHYGLADKYLRQAHLTAPLDEEIMMATAINLNKMGLYAESNKFLTKLLSTNQQNANAHYNLGVNFFFLNNRDEACLEFAEAMSLGHAGAKQMHFRHCKP